MEKTELTKTQTKSKLFAKILNILFYILITLMLIIACFNIIFDSANIEGISMQPGINSNWSPNKTGDTAYYSNIIDNKINNGDIIIATAPDNTLVIKRMIAQAGDNFAFIYKDNAYYLFVNGIEVDEGYLLNQNINNITHSKILTLISENVIPAENITSGFVDDNNLYYSDYIITIPENCCFYLGDNRAASDDCSNYGIVETSTIVSKVLFVVPSNTTLIGFLWSKIFS